MLNDHAQQWVEALRSGEYPQTTGALATADGYCCLGVACELYRRDTGNGNWARITSMPLYMFVEGKYTNAEELPVKVADWLGLKAEIDNLGHMPSGGGLAAINDNGSTFAEIADVIEAHADELFKTA